MDSDRFNAMAFSMGVKRSKILLPWEELPLREIFGAKRPLIPPAAWVPEPGVAIGAIEPDRTVSKGHLGKIFMDNKDYFDYMACF